jgi:uncharacterized protein with PQ loop repeat
VLLASTAAYTAAVLGCFIAIPQIALLVRTRDSAGLSVRSWEIGSLSATAWFAYGVRVDQPAQILANSCALVGGLLVLWFALEPGSRRRNELRGFAVVCGLVAVAVVAAPLPWLTIPLAATGIASRLPQVRTTASTWWHRRTSAVSTATWAMTGLVATLWLVDGLIIGDAAIAGSAGLSAVSAGLILLAETTSRPAWLDALARPAAHVTDDDAAVSIDAPRAGVRTAPAPDRPLRRTVTDALAPV